MSNIQYRSDIDGLRALAVLPVMLFHAGASWLPGGFVGVDVFFVISGYLISSIILREVQSGKFSLASFYERRARRILPALLVMLLVTAIAFQVISLPDQAVSASESGIAALLSLSNFYFWKESGYFSPESEFMPFLHTWSLAVEEQFYVLFPLILIALWRFNLSIKAFIFFGTIAAFFISLWLSMNKPSFAYYMLPSRAWELAIGAMIASGSIPEIKGRVLSQVVPAAGVSLVIFSLFYIRSDMIFPGWVALVPCLGTAMILHSDGSSWVARHILSWRPLVFAGLLSYSLYLWHWPVLAALRVATANIHLKLEVAAVGLIVASLLGWLSWRYVERPFRDSGRMSANSMFKIFGVCSGAILSLAIVSIHSSGFPSRLDESARSALAGSRDIDPLRNKCRDVKLHDGCRFGNLEAPITYAIIGDSHAAAIRPAIEKSNLLKDAAGTLYWMRACPFLQGARIVGHENIRQCELFRDDVWRIIESDQNIDTVILSARWSFALTGWRPESGDLNREWLEDEETDKHSAEENSKVFARSLRRTLDRLNLLGLRTIIVGAVPEPGFDVPNALAMDRYYGRLGLKGVPRYMVQQRAGVTDSFIYEIASEVSGVQFLPIWEGFCDRSWCAVEVNGSPVYYDDDHLSYSGAVQLVAPLINRKAGLNEFVLGNN